MLKVPYFTQAYLEDGLTADEFIYHPAVVVTAKEIFEKNFWDDRLNFRSIRKKEVK